MRGRRALIDDREGALHTMEAIIAAFLLFSALACVQSISGHISPDSNDDLEQMSTDLLYIMEHGQNGPGHPGLAQALSSQAAWSEQSAVLLSEIESHVPAGCYVFLHTPYGDAGKCPPDFVSMTVRPFIAYSPGSGGIIEGRIVVWRP
jgi:hypothetical protein